MKISTNHLRKLFGLAVLTFVASITAVHAQSINGETNNVALAANRATIIASSTHSSNFSAENAINGDRKGAPWDNGGYWNDAIPNPSTSTDWLEITFDDDSAINKINVFSVQDTYWAPVEPNKSLTFTNHGLVDFRVEVWLNNSWTAIPDGRGVVTGNNKVWTQITFPTIVTKKIKIVVTKASDQWVRIAEVEAITQHQGCASPGLQQEELLATIQNNYTGDTGTIYWDGYRDEAHARWRKCLNPNFSAWEVNGSQNLPVLGAAIGLFREPTLNMTRPNDLQRIGTPTYIKWWNDFLGYQTGALETTNKSVGHFKGTEIFSSIYDGPVLTAIVAVRYWTAIPGNSSKPGAANIGLYARRYLRANWFVYGLSAGAAPATRIDIPDASWAFNPYASLINEAAGNPPKHAGHFIALAGSRSNEDYMTEGLRAALFDRAIQYSNKSGRDGTYDLSSSNEARNQRLLLNHLKNVWSNSTENLYGLTAADRTAFRDLVNNGNTGYFDLNDWLNGINTFRTVRILGWNVGGKQVRVSTLESNPNGNTPAMYGVKYEQATGMATFLYPWTNNHTAGKCHLAGGSILYSDRVEASQPGVKLKPGCTVIAIPGRSATMTIPQSGLIFHLVLSNSQPAYWEPALQSSYPAVQPYSPWEEIPPGNDDSPIDN